MQNYTDRYVFAANWFQAEANLGRKMYLYFFPADQSVELYDIRTRKTFLRRVKVPQLVETDLFIGAKLSIYGRQIEIVDYADAPTRKSLSARRQKSILLVKPDAVSQLGQIVSVLGESGFTVQKCRTVRLTQAQAEMIFLEKQRMDDARLTTLIDNLTAGWIVAFELVGNDAVSRLKELVGPDCVDSARVNHPDTLRARFGQDEVNNAVLCAESLEKADQMIEMFFGPKADFIRLEAAEKSTLCLIKPHAVKEGKTGGIIRAIQENGFRVNAIQMFHLERANCEEFLEIYKGVVSEYVQMVSQLSNGPCFALEITAPNDVYVKFREFCGPVDPEIAQQLRPHTLRAQFGVTKVLNAVHCTDLDEDTGLEVEYFFKIMQ